MKALQTLMRQRGVTYAAEYVGTSYPSWTDVHDPDAMPVHTWRITLSRAGCTWRFLWWASVAETYGSNRGRVLRAPRAPKPPKPEDVFPCLCLDHPATLTEFMREHGHDASPLDVLRAYVEAVQGYAMLHCMFGPDGLEELREAVEEL